MEKNIKPLDFLIRVAFQIQSFHRICPEKVYARI